MDDEIDRMNCVAHAELIKVIQARSEVAAQALQAIIISRNLERDRRPCHQHRHDVIFWVRGADVRHQLSAADS